jgi:hypothetical protein
MGKIDLGMAVSSGSLLLSLEAIPKLRGFFVIRVVSERLLNANRCAMPIPLLELHQSQIVERDRGVGAVFQSAAEIGGGFREMAFLVMKNPAV